MRILDLYCCAGGAARGYADAGFEVVGVDISPQPNYPYDFVEADVLGLDIDWIASFDAVHASPPCQFGTAYRRRPGVAVGAENLIPATRDLILGSGRPYVIENVDTKDTRPWLRDPVRLCGSSFGLDVRRHRLFECSFPLEEPPCDHSWQTPRFPPATNRTNLRRTVEVGVWRIPLEVQQRAMGIDWMELKELSQAIPPAYTNHIGQALAKHLSEAMARA